MKTLPDPMPQAEHQLTQVANRFDQWRQTRTTPAEPIPQHLWEQAIALTATFPITRVATRLRRERRGVEKALCRPPRRSRCASALHRFGLCGSAHRTRLATPHRGDGDRTPAP